MILLLLLLFGIIIYLYHNNYLYNIEFFSNNSLLTLISELPFNFIQNNDTIKKIKSEKVQKNNSIVSLDKNTDDILLTDSIVSLDKNTNDTNILTIY